MSDEIDMRWIKGFADLFKVVSLVQYEKLQMIPAMQLEIEHEVIRHLGRMKRWFENEDFDENSIRNDEETQFIFNMDRRKTLCFYGDDEVWYADVTSGGEGMNMLVNLSGAVCAKIEPPLMIFKKHLQELSDSGHTR